MVHYLVMWLVLLGIEKPIFATSVGFTAGAIARFLMAYFHVFEPESRIFQSLGKFAFVLSCQFLANSTLLGIVLGLGVPVWPAQLISTASLTLFIFFAHKIWVFR